MKATLIVSSHLIFYDGVSNLFSLVIAIARPLAANPSFVQELLTGKADQAAPNLIPSSLSIRAAHVQLGQIANDLPIWDYSSKEGVDNFINSLPKREPPLPDKQQKVV